MVLLSWRILPMYGQSDTVLENNDHLLTEAWWVNKSDFLPVNNFYSQAFVHKFTVQKLQAIIYKTGVINDPLGQPTNPAGSDCHLNLKFWDEWTNNLCENSDHYGPGLRSASWISYWPTFIFGFRFVIAWHSWIRWRKIVVFSLGKLPSSYWALRRLEGCISYEQERRNEKV